MTVMIVDKGKKMPETAAQAATLVQAETGNAGRAVASIQNQVGANLLAPLTLVNSSLQIHFEFAVF